MCENLVEKSATVKKELIPTATAIKLAAAVTAKPTAIACGSSKNHNNNNNNNNNNISTTISSGCDSAALSLFDQLKNSISHNLAVTDRITNNKNGNKIKTLLSHNQEMQPHSNNSNKTQIYHGRSLLKSPPQQQEKNTNSIVVEHFDEVETDDIEESPHNLVEKMHINNNQLISPLNTLNYEEQEERPPQHLVVEDDEEYNDSSASSISATTAPLQIALDSTSSHSSNSNSFVEYCEKIDGITPIHIPTKIDTTSIILTEKSKKLSLSDLKEKFEVYQQHTATIACQTQPLSFLSSSSNEITTGPAAMKQTTITATNLNTSNSMVGKKFFTTDVGKTVMDGGENIKKPPGEQQKQNILIQAPTPTPISTSSFTTTSSGTSSLLLPTTTISPLLGIVHGTKRATMTPAVTLQQQNTRSVASTNSLAHSSVSATSFIDVQQSTKDMLSTTTTTTTITSTTTTTTATKRFLTTTSSGVSSLGGGATRNRKSIKHQSNNMTVYGIHQQQQQQLAVQQQQHVKQKLMPMEEKQQQKQLHQVSNNTPTHFQRNQHKTTGNSNSSSNMNHNVNKKIQKSVLDFGRLNLHEHDNCNLESSSNDRIDNKRKRCNDRYDSSESSDR